MKDVKDILDTNGNSILRYITFISKYKIKTNFLQYYKVVSALKLFRQKRLNNPKGPKPKTFGQTLLASENACKTVYKSIVKKRPPPLLKARDNGCLRKIKYNRRCECELGEYIPPPFSKYNRNKVTSVPIHIPSQTNSSKRLPP